MIRASKTAWFLLAATGLATVTGFTTFAIGLDRQALWPVVQACVADYKLTTAPFPCLAVDLSGGEENGNVALRPPFTHDLIVSPTRRVVGIEDPFLQSRDAPNYFDAAWRARSFLTDAGERPPNRDAIALVVNSAFVRIQDQLHIHVGCLLFRPSNRRSRRSLPRSRSGNGNSLPPSSLISCFGEHESRGRTYVTYIRSSSWLRPLPTRFMTSGE